MDLASGHSPSRLCYSNRDSIDVIRDLLGTCYDFVRDLLATYCTPYQGVILMAGYAVEEFYRSLFPAQYSPLVLSEK